MERQEHGSSKSQDRSNMEKKRRKAMKALYSQLNFLIASHGSKKARPLKLDDHLDEAVNYIKKLEKNLEMLKKSRETLMMGIDEKKGTISSGEIIVEKGVQFEVHSTGSALEVVVISKMNSQSIFYETIRMLHEEGVHVVNAGFAIVNDNIIHTIHSEVEEFDAGYGVPRITRRLNKIVDEFSKC